MPTPLPLKTLPKRLPWWARARQALHHAYRVEGKGNPYRATQYALRVLHKETRQRLFSRRNQPKALLFVFGCQRSGTSLILRMFDRDPDAAVFPEGSPKVFEEVNGQKQRLQPLAAVQRVLLREHAPFVVLKPLMDSQNAPEILSYFEGSKGAWVYRHYTDVANSNLKRFGMDNGLNTLRAIATNLPGNWLAERASDEVRATVSRFFSEEMSPYDAAALFWYARNSLFFDLGLDRHPEVRLCKYEALVTDPVNMMAELYAFLQRPFPGKHLAEEAHRDSLGKGRRIPLSPEVDALCRVMLDRLDRAYEAQRAPIAA